MPSEDFLARTLSSIETKVDRGFEKTHERIDKLVEQDNQHNTQLAVVSQRLDSQETQFKELKVKVESKSMPPSEKSQGLSQKTIAAIVSGIVLVLGGGGVAVNRVQAQADHDEALELARERAQREALASLARAMQQSQEAQSATVEAAVTLDEEAATKAKKAAERAAVQARLAEKALTEDPQ